MPDTSSSNQLGASNFNLPQYNQSAPDMFGTGMFRPSQFQIAGGQFVNPNYQPGAYQNLAGNYLGATTSGITAAGSTPVTPTNYNTGTAGQLGLARTYGQMAAGAGPSLAAVTAGQQGAANLAATESMLGSARGAGNPAAAQLAARNAAATGQQQVAQNAVQGRTQEELAALGAQGGLFGNIAGQGLTASGQTLQNQQFNAGQANAIAQANQANKLAAYTNLLGSYGTQGLAQQQGGIAGQQLGVQQQLGLNDIQEKAYQNAAQNNQKVTGGVMSGIGSAISGLTGGLF